MIVLKILHVPHENPDHSCWGCIQYFKQYIWICFFSWVKFQICNLTCSWLTICNFRYEKLDLPWWKIFQCHRHSVQIFSFIAKPLKIQQNFPCSWNKIPNCIYSSSEFQSWSGQLWIDSSKCSSYTFSANWYCNEFEHYNLH